MHKMLLGLAALAAGAMPLSHVSAAVVYGTTFESPTFATGNISGQDGWMVSAGGGNATIVNSPAAAHSGSQFVLYTTVPAANTSKFAWKPLNLSAATLAAEPILTATVFTAMASSTSTNTSIGGLDLYNIAGARIAALSFTNAGALQALDPSGEVTLASPPTAALDVYNRLTIAVNFATHDVGFFFNGTLVGTTTAATATDFGDGDFRGVRVGNAAGGNQIAWDDLLITTSVPEPATLCLAGLAMIPLLARRRSC